MNILAETMKHAYADRAKYLGDPDFVRVPTRWSDQQEICKRNCTKNKLGKATAS